MSSCSLWVNQATEACIDVVARLWAGAPLHFLYVIEQGRKSVEVEGKICKIIPMQAVAVLFG